MGAHRVDVRQKIAKELQAKLSPTEKVMMTRKPTENGEAYLAFVQAHNLFMNPEDLAKQKQAEQLYERALELDPSFALACARLSQLESWLYHTFEPTSQHREKSRTLAERALRLQADLPEGHLALGFSIYYLERDYERALKEFALAQKGLPNEAEVYLAIGAIQRRQGNWTESTANQEKAVTLSPNDTWPLQNLTLNYQMLRNFDAADKTIDRALKLAPRSFNLWSLKAQNEIAGKGTFETTKRASEALASKTLSEEDRIHIEGALIDTLLLQRKYAEALQRAEKLTDESLAREPEGALFKYEHMGIARNLLGDKTGAREALLTAKRRCEKYVSDSPDDGKRLSKLAGILAWLGEKDAAIAEGKRAMELLPESVDAFEGPSVTQSLAEIYAIVGEQEKAIDLLDGLLGRPSPVTVAMLKLVPIWDPLRGNPRFISLLKKYGG